MSSKHDDPSNEIPAILFDKSKNAEYKRCRLFGKVKNIHFISLNFQTNQLYLCVYENEFSRNFHVTMTIE